MWLDPAPAIALNIGFNYVVRTQSTVGPHYPMIVTKRPRSSRSPRLKNVAPNVYGVELSFKEHSLHTSADDS